MFGPTTYTFSIDMSKEELLAVYSGSIQRIRVTTREGLVLELDAQHLKEFTTMEGIHGVFKLTVNRENKFLSLRQIG
ncbi:MAG: DUF2835 domain-containing protein [Succinivibrio sp.]|nr:DUF2835 domain-containing protein [Succinivibrio sp.]